jgi:hypothetical protein
VQEDFALQLQPQKAHFAEQLLYQLAAIVLAAHENFLAVFACV